MLMIGCGGGSEQAVSADKPGAAEKKSEDQMKPVKLTIWETYGTEEKVVFQKIVRDYMKQNPHVTIETQALPWNEHEPKIMNSVITRSSPDLARVGVSFVAKLESKRALTPLNDLGAMDVRDDYFPASFDSNIVNGKIYGLPDQTTCLALFYNTDMFKAAGLDPDKPPTTWDEFVEYGKKLTDEEKGVYGFGMENYLWWTLPFFYTFGADIVSEDGKKCILDSPEGIAALQFKADLYQKHKIEGGAWVAGGINPENGFINKKYAMIFMGPWNVKHFKDNKINFKVGLIPAGKAGTATNVGGSDMVVMRGCKNPRAAFDFLRFLTNKENQLYWARKLNQLPVSIAAAAEFQKEADPITKVFLEQIKTARARPQITNYDELENICNPEMESALSNQKKVKDALESAVKKIDLTVLQESY
jgi:ABC-type glycerol-3-phosphate transport system substrate-binding protein